MVKYRFKFFKSNFKLFGSRRLTTTLVCSNTLFISAEFERHLKFIQTYKIEHPSKENMRNFHKETNWQEKTTGRSFLRKQNYRNTLITKEIQKAASKGILELRSTMDKSKNNNALPLVIIHNPNNPKIVGKIKENFKFLSNSAEMNSVLAISEESKRPGNSDVDNASRDCFWGRAFCLRPLKQSHDPLSTSLSVA